MTARRLFLLLVAYLAFDLGDPVLPGAFSFEVEDSEIEEAVHTQRRGDRREVDATRLAPEPDRVALRQNGAPRPTAVTIRPVRAPSSTWQAPRSALLAFAAPQSPEDH